jgi:hypothetical protein
MGEPKDAGLLDKKGGELSLRQAREEIRDKDGIKRGSDLVANVVKENDALTW